MLYADGMVSARAQQSKASRFLSLVVRTVFLSLLFGLIGMGIGLFAGIIGMVVLAFAKGVHPDMQVAYLRVAIPVAIAFAAIAFVYNVIGEIRRSGRRD
jgi:uncharacterized BrkB/YihY/UPF0761 family membrane protein